VPVSADRFIFNFLHNSLLFKFAAFSITRACDNVQDITGVYHPIPDSVYDGKYPIEISHQLFYRVFSFSRVLSFLA
jgi:hypothetical protein